MALVPLLLSLITAIATLFGGSVALYGPAKQVQLRYLMAFAAGTLVAIAFLDMVPVAGPQWAAVMAIGFFSVYLAEKLILIHTCPDEECETHILGWPAMVGVASESLVDGLAIAIAYALEPALGLLVALAVFIHEMPRGFATAVIMRSAGRSMLATWSALAIDAGFAPLGVLVATVVPEAFFQPLVAFAAGVFLYVGASDLLPEAHRRFNIKVVLLVLLGASLIGALTVVFHE